MAVSRNPYREWQRGRTTGDYRNTDTQVTSLVRQQLSQSEYLTRSNRVSPGPYRATRVEIAKQTSIVPHVFGSEDIWGWQSWVNNISENLISPIIAPSLFEVDIPIPGTSYRPYNNIGGASYIDEQSSQTYSVEIGLEPPVFIPDSAYSATRINTIPVDTSELSTTSYDYLMIYNPVSNNFTFKSPSYILGLSAFSAMI